jgi:Docking domain of Afi1 for Arf3 in vesicle trafficking
MYSSFCSLSLISTKALSSRTSIRSQLERTNSTDLPVQFVTVSLTPSQRQLAELMLPDGVHQRSEDWTIFLLNQSPENSIATPFHEHDEAVSETNGTKEDKKELLYVLNLVRTKHDQNVRR